MSTPEKNTLRGTVYLIPARLHDSGAPVILPYVLDAVKQCEVFFVENERSARRFLKTLWKEMEIDRYQWFVIHKAESAVRHQLVTCLREGKTVGIISEAGCPGVADPGQVLVGVAHQENATVRPLVGPSSILLALMASGLNGQRFQFNGYLPIGNEERIRAIRQLESESQRNNCTQLCIETPYRNNQFLAALIRACHPATRLCIATDLTTEHEFIRTQTIGAWKKDLPDLHKRPTVFCLLG